MLVVHPAHNGQGVYLFELDPTGAWWAQFLVSLKNGGKTKILYPRILMNFLYDPVNLNQVLAIFQVLAPMEMVCFAILFRLISLSFSFFLSV